MMLMMKIEWLIIDRSLAGKLSEAEQEQLDRWLSESPAHVKMYERIKVRRTSGFEQPEFEQWREEFRLRRQRAGRRLLGSCGGIGSDGNRHLFIRADESGAGAGASGEHIY